MGGKEQEKDGSIMRVDMLLCVFKPYTLCVMGEHTSPPSSPQRQGHSHSNKAYVNWVAIICCLQCL